MLFIGLKHKFMENSHGARDHRHTRKQDRKLALDLTIDNTHAV